MFSTVTLFEPLANAVNWVDNVRVDEGDTVVIQGPGHQGLAVLEAVRAQVLELLNEMRRRGEQFGLITVCAAGAMGFAMVVKAE